MRQKNQHLQDHKNALKARHSAFCALARDWDARGLPDAARAAYKIADDIRRAHSVALHYWLRSGKASA